MDSAPESSEGKRKTYVHDCSYSSASLNTVLMNCCRNYHFHTSPALRPQTVGGGKEKLVYDQVLNTKQCLLELPGANVHVWIPTAISVRLCRRVFMLGIPGGECVQTNKKQ